MKRLGILSHNDIDGWGVNVICKVIERFNKDVKFGIKNCSYKSINTVGYKFFKGEEDEFVDFNIKNVDKLYITDITMSDKMMAWADKFKDKVKCLDHHYETKAYLNDLYDWCKIEHLHYDGIFTSGTLMFYMEMLEIGYITEEMCGTDIFNRLREFAYRVRDYDTWQWKANNDTVPKKLNDVFFMLKDAFVKEQVKAIIYNYDIVEEYKVHLDLKEQAYQDYKRSKINYVKKFEFKGLKFGLLFTDQYISQLGNDLCEEIEDIDAMMLVDCDKATVSLRSIGDINVGQIAKELGGGGHLNASGFILDSEVIFNNFLTLLK